MKILNKKNIAFLIIFLMPCYLIKVRYSFIATNLLEIFMLVWLIVVLAKEKKEFYAKTVKEKFFLLPLGLIFVGLVISMIAGGNYRAGLGIIKSWFLVPIAFAWILNAGLNKEERAGIYKAIFFSCLAVSFLALEYFFLGKVTFDGRLQAFFNSPNYLAMFLAPGIIIGVILGRKEKNYIFLTIILAIVFYLTFSYAAWLALAVALSCIIIFLKENKKKFLAILLLFLLIVFSFQFKNIKLISALSFSGRSSIASREMIWNSALEMIKNNSIFGIGPGNFQSKYLEYQKYFPPYLEWAVPHPHNLYLAFWLYSGILGLAGFFWLLILWNLKVKKNPSSREKYITIAIMIYFLAHGSVDTTYFQNDLALIFWLNFFILL